MIARPILKGVKSSKKIQFRRRKLSSQPQSQKNVLAIKKEGRNESQWQQVKDENTGRLYWWNQETNETTSYSVEKPKDWEAVESDKGVYWWCRETNETTAAGAPRPTWKQENYGALQQVQAPPSNVFLQSRNQNQNAAGPGLKYYFAMVFFFFFLC